MKTILYNNITNEVEGKAREGSYDGIWNSALSLVPGWTPNYIIELEYIAVPQPSIEPTEVVTDEWIADTEAGTYTQVWNVRDMTEAELVNHINQLSAASIQQVKDQLAQQEIDNKYADNLTVIEQLNDEDALNVKQQYKPFNPNGYPYVENERFYYPVDDKLYKVKPGQGHTSQPDWLPNTAVSLYEEVYVVPNNPCENTPLWDSSNWGNYTVGYQVKLNNAIWEAINTTHTWIAPAHTGDGAISWIWIRDCN